MKSNEILQALSLTKNKETTNYCSKLANLFAFILLVKPDLIEGAIVECNGTINSNGKLLDLVKIEKKYKESLLNNYRWNDSDVKELNVCINSYSHDLYKVRETLHKKRKNKDNSLLEAQRDELEGNIESTKECVSQLVDNEKIRLLSVNNPIQDMRKELQLMEVNKVMIETKQGIYSFWLPVNNKFYYEVMRMLNVPFEIAKVEIVTAKYKFITYPDILDNIKKANAFVSIDDLRPAMTGVCLDFSSEGLQVVATDAHKMYYSKHISYDGSKGDMKFIIAPESVKVLNRLKADNDSPLTILIYNDTKASINGIDITLIDARFPDYKVVIPEYKNYMEFDRAKMIANVKKVLPYSNKSTGQVNLHLNGSIAMHCEDVDFSFECDADMPYVSKFFDDTDIAFNGKFLTICLTTFKEENVKMFTDGSSTKAAIFSNDTDNVLLMPLMLNS